MNNKYILYPSTVKDLAAEIKTICDDYFARRLSNDEIQNLIIGYAETEADKLFERDSINPTISKIIGKKRLDIVLKILSNHHSASIEAFNLLCDKVNAEFAEYSDSLLNESPQIIFEHSYESTIKKEILNILLNEELTLKETQYLLQLPDLLSTCYFAWLHNDLDMTDGIRTTVYNVAQAEFNY